MMLLALNLRRSKKLNMSTSANPVISCAIAVLICVITVVAIKCIL